MQDFIITLLICSVTMSMLALFYMATTPLVEKHYSAKGRYYAWLIIIIGLIIPFRPQFDNAVVKMDMQSEAAIPIIQIGNGEPINIPMPISEPIFVDNAVLPPAHAMPDISWWQIVAAVWLSGMMIFFIYHAIKHYRFIKLTARWSENITDEQMLTLYQSLKTEIGIRKQVDLKLCTSVGSPMMIGFLNPRILLPKIDFTQDELRLILNHELNHYKRKDLWYKLLVLIASAIHWFNPIVHLITRNINILCELSCDDEVVRSMDEDTRQFYSETIIGVVRHQSKLITALSTNFYGGKKGMKKRIYSIMDTRKKRAGFAIICAALIITLGTGFAFAFTAVKDKVISWDNFPTEMVERGFLPVEVVDALPDFGKEVKEDGLTLYSWNVRNRNEDENTPNIYLAVTENIMTAYHYAQYNFNAPHLNETLSMDDATKMVIRFADRFIPYAGHLTFENKPYEYDIYVPGHIEPWVADYPGLGEFVVAVDLDMGSIIFYSFIPSEFAGMTKTLAADGSIATITWDKETYVPFGTITDTSLFRQFSFVNGDINDIVFGLEGYTLRDWMINYDESKATYMLLKAAHVTDIPPELAKWGNEPVGINDAAVDTELGEFLNGTWVVSKFLGFDAITKDDVEWPDGENIIGKTVIIGREVFSTKDFGVAYERYAVEIKNPVYQNGGALTGEDFSIRLWQPTADESIAELTNEDITLINPVSSDFEESGSALYVIDNTRLLISLNCDYFELVKVSAENDVDNQ